MKQSNYETLFAKVRGVHASLSFLTNEVNWEIFKLVAKKEGITQMEIIQHLQRKGMLSTKNNVGQSQVAVSTKLLIFYGWIESKKDGKFRRHYISEKCLEKAQLITKFSKDFSYEPVI